EVVKLAWPQAERAAVALDQRAGVVLVAHLDALGGPVIEFPRAAVDLEDAHGQLVLELLLPGGVGAGAPLARGPVLRGALGQGHDQEDAEQQGEDVDERDEEPRHASLGQADHEAVLRRGLAANGWVAHSLREWTTGSSGERRPGRGAAP